MSRLDQIRDERLKKVEKLRQMQIDPYPSFMGDNSEISEARNNLGSRVKIVGRLLAMRGHGKLTFGDLQDTSGKIQLMLKKDLIPDTNWQLVELLDVGDFVCVSGEVSTSQSGELSVLVQEITLLSKAVRPLPEKWHGLTDIEERYRQRYVDLLMNEEAKQVFLTRTKVVKFLRKYLDDHNFIEVETPVLQPIYGGATAQPFTTRHQALDCNLFLRISDELYLKRLIVGGFQKVYEMSKDFRNEGLSREHNPEFTMLEFYWAYSDYEALMKFSEQMLSELVLMLKGDTKITYQGKEYDFKTPWPRVSYRSLFQEYLQIDIDVTNTEVLLSGVIAERNLLPQETVVGYANMLDKLYKRHIRPKLGGPMFVTDYPTEMIPLAKRKSDDATKVATFQLVINGSEFIKAYNELNDPEDQRQRWEKEMKLAESGALEHQVLDEDYIRALEYGMPPTAGWGMGIDRLTAFLTDQTTLKDVILFPTLRPE